MIRLIKVGFALLFSLLLVTSVSFSQNLVPNPGFEEFKKCPVTFSTDPLHFGPNFWSSPSQGTPDYYNKCTFGDMDVPRNWAGVSVAHGGVGYAGIYVWSNKRTNYREYIQCKLKEPLKANAKYTIQFFYRLSSYSVYAVDRVGLALSNDEVKATHDKLLEVKPTFTEVKEIESLTNGWLAASAKVTAVGGEQFLVIGNFSSDDSTKNRAIENRYGMSPMLSGSAYYYVDDVSVVPEALPATHAPDTVQLVAAPRPNEVYILKHIYFKYNSYELLQSSFPELDLLVSILKKNTLWKIQLTGHTDDQGNDEYNLSLSVNRAKSVAQYLKMKGVAEQRMQTQGSGKQFPIQVGLDEPTRSRNRRVEVKFLE
jgi:outer membrane protein OmpA-like peptidoglycan-associated protein